MIGSVAISPLCGHRITLYPFHQLYRYVGGAIDIVVAVLLFAVAVAIGVWSYFMWGLERRVTTILQDAIRKEVILQDDRIQKRLSRMEGQASDAAATAVDGSADAVIGRPFRRR